MADSKHNDAKTSSADSASGEKVVRNAGDTGSKDAGHGDVEDVKAHSVSDRGNNDRTWEQGESRHGSPESYSNERELNDIDREIDHSAKDLRALQEHEITGTESGIDQSIAYSDTDEDENEGLGDGKLGRDRHEDLQSK